MADRDVADSLDTFNEQDCVDKFLEHHASSCSLAKQGERQLAVLWKTHLMA